MKDTSVELSNGNHFKIIDTIIDFYYGTRYLGICYENNNIIAFNPRDIKKIIRVKEAKLNDKNIIFEFEDITDNFLVSDIPIKNLSKELLNLMDIKI